MWISARHWRRLVLVSVSALVLLGVLSGCHKKVVVHPLITAPIPVCGTVNITPGSNTVAPSVDVEVCTIAPGQTIAWVCDISLNSNCKKWQVIFDDPRVDNAKLFLDGLTKFPSQPSDTQSQAGATLINTLVTVPNAPIVVKYTVKNGFGKVYDPHIVPMAPGP